jgi:hypothetical protein
MSDHEIDLIIAYLRHMAGRKTQWGMTGAVDRRRPAQTDIGGRILTFGGRS